MPREARQVPELLTDEDMHRFMTDADFREYRRAEDLGALPPPASHQVVRGYKREWLFETDDIPTPPNFPDAAAEAIQERVAQVNRPFTDDITEGYDLYSVTEGAVRSYLRKPTTAYLGATALEWYTRRERQAIEQGAERMPKHIVDGLLRNLWVKQRIADIRQAYINRYTNMPWAEWSPDDPTLAVVADAVADLGYCMRYRLQADWQVDEDKLDPREARKIFTAGLLKKAGIQARLDLAGAPQHIEHIGLYAAAGQPEVLADNLGLVELVRHQQKIRSMHWGSRFQITVATTGEQLTTTDTETDNSLKLLLRELYGEPTESQGREPS